MSFVTGARTGRHRRSAAAPPPPASPPSPPPDRTTPPAFGIAAISSHLTDSVQIDQRHPSDQRRRLVPARAGQRRHRLAPPRAWPISPACTTFLQGTTTTFQVVPNPSTLGWRSLFGAWYVEDTIKLRPNLTLRAGLRHEFTTGWNEASGRAANYVTGCQRRSADHTPSSAIPSSRKNNAKKLFGPRVALAWDPFRQRQNRRPRRLRNLLFADRRPQLPAELAAALQRRGVLFRSAAYHHSDRSRRAAAASSRRTRCPAPLHHLRPARHPGGRQNAHRSGVELHHRAAAQRNTALRVAYVGSFGISRPAQRRSQYDPCGDLRQRRRLHGGRRPAARPRSR